MQSGYAALKNEFRKDLFGDAGFLKALSISPPKTEKNNC